MYIGSCIKKNEPEYLDIDKQKNGEVVGSSGSGKTWFVNNLLNKIIENTDNEVRIFNMSFRFKRKYYENVEQITEIVNNDRGCILEGLDDLKKESNKRKNENKKHEDIYVLFIHPINFMYKIKEEYGESMYIDIANKIKNIAKNSEDTGIKFIFESQRPLKIINELEVLEDYITWNYITFFEIEGDYNKTLGLNKKGERLVENLGEGTLKTKEGLKDIQLDATK